MNMGGNDNSRMTSALPSTVALPAAVRLTDWGVIRAQGADAASFLHSQLTQDITGLPLGEARLAGYCSPKGRLLASFLVWKTAEDTVLLACSADLLPATLKRLSMFVLRAKCKLSDASAERSLWGVVGNGSVGPWQVQGDESASLVGLPAVDGVARALWCGAADAQPQAASPMSQDTWRWLEVRSAVPRITAATVEQFVPQMINLEAVGGVNFRKGCYPGQEVVARSQYRGTLKRRSFLFTSAAPASPGAEVFHSADPAQPAGMVVNAASVDGRHAALVEVKLSACDDGTLHLGAVDGPALQREELPYALETEPA